MSIAELGSLGEFLGSIAVLVSLVILVLQVRGARAELSGRMTREIKRDNNLVMDHMTQPGLMDIHIRGQRSFDTLSEAEKLMWLYWLFTWINQTEDAWNARARGMPDMGWVDGYLLGVALVLRSEGGRIAWSRLRGFFESSFVDALDRKISEDKTTFLETAL